MFARTGLVLVLTSVATSTTEAQRQQPTDSLIAYWIDRGALANWQPHLLFTGCPRLEEWQRRGIDLLLSADLGPERTRDLATAWMFPLKQCHDSRVERWYFEHIDAAIRRGEPEGQMIKFWVAMEHGDSPAIREYLRNLMLDTSKPESYRNSAGVALFVRFGPQERMREYLGAFETRRMPFEVSVGQTTTLLKQDADVLLREVGNLVRQNPELADQLAFTGVVESSGKYASAAARRNLGEALQEGLNRPGLSASQRSRLDSSVQHLMRPSS